MLWYLSSFSALFSTASVGGKLCVKAEFSFALMPAAPTAATPGTPAQA